MEAQKTKFVTTRATLEELEVFRQLAKAESRSVSAQILHLMRVWIKQQQEKN